MAKRTYASVTEELCSCNYLQRSANDSESPIEFDSRTSEYQFQYGNSMMVIYHCPFCGGAAPESKRELLFATVPRSEEERLTELLKGVHTIDDALARLGAPDFDGESTSRRPERNGEAPRIQHHRNIRYENLSDVAVIHITERQDGSCFWYLYGKPLV